MDAEESNYHKTRVILKLKCWISSSLFFPLPRINERDRVVRLPRAGVAQFFLLFSEERFLISMSIHQGGDKKGKIVGLSMFRRTIRRLEFSWEEKRIAFFQINLTKRKILILFDLKIKKKNIEGNELFSFIGLLLEYIAVSYAAMQMMTGRITTFDAIVSRT